MTKEQNIAFVQAVYERATAQSDYNHEACWTHILDGRDADGLAEGEVIGTGQFEEEAWESAARRIISAGQRTPTGVAMWQRLAFVEKFLSANQGVLALVGLEETQKLAEHGDGIVRGYMLLLCQVFDAGREFQKCNPDPKNLLPFPIK